MAKANMKCMHINIWVHHMQVDQLFDFLNGRIDQAPIYWLSREEAPLSVTGGHVQISLSYEGYSRLSSLQGHEETHL